MGRQKLRGGIDVGSTTVKVVILDEQNNSLYETYQRHFSDVKKASRRVLSEAAQVIGKQQPISFTITGSGGMGLAETLGLTFVQEVIACTKTVETVIPETNVAIELGGEDAKITFFGASLEQRMNGSCAGGTGAFIDQMATLLKTDAAGLNELAKGYETIYPIASRCGVFAKTDIQPLVNDGARKEDLAASIFQAVVNQTIAGLASGHKITGKVAFLGGPLYFMSELRQRFIETLNLSSENTIFPKNPQLFVAKGAALYAEGKSPTTIAQLIEHLDEADSQNLKPTKTLPPLFKDEKELQKFRERHQKARVEKGDLATYHGDAFLGIDAGSTTTKIVLMGEDHKLLYTWYGNNEGDPLKKTITILKEMYLHLPSKVKIVKTCTTGYGEKLIKSALKADLGEVETVAHYKAAHYFMPDVDFILDIGGQDMKAMHVKNGALSTIQLNEACSSGCGSFIETFANSLKYDVKKFAQIALLTKNPADLGSRCTVFMQSKVKQAQKEGSSVGDISAGLSISVIKNALFKVIKARSAKDLGKHIVCQGGTFYNEAVLRAFEKLSGQDVIRPNIAGLMGAYGAALIAQERSKAGDVSSLLTTEEMDGLSSTRQFDHCGRCENNCLLTITVFNDGRKFITGNRCEKGLRIKLQPQDQRVNLVKEKYHHLFDYRPLRKRLATRGIIGIPRVLNIYENYPLWAVFFKKLGIRAQLSTRSSEQMYEKGIETIPSDTVCYPAKMVHGHVQWLIDRGIKTIFYPSIVFERKESKNADNHYNCPIVQSYPDVIRNNVDQIRSGEIDYRNPYLNLNDHKSAARNLYETFKDKGVTLGEVEDALEEGYKELKKFKQWVQNRGEETLRLMRQNHQKGIVLAGRPYHLDPQINHGISQIIAAEGFHVLTEDSISHMEDVAGLRVVNQWTYHSRLFAAAKVAAKTPELEFVQLNSFGCGIDAITTDQVEEILAQHNRLYTVLKIDEGTNVGAIRIRLRSLKAAVNERHAQHVEPKKLYDLPQPVKFTKEMKKKHTLLMPMLSPIHQAQLVDVALQASGYNVVNLPVKDSNAVDMGTKYVNNDACYPAIITIGQMLEALKSGKYDVNNTSVMMSQTGGGCRATNYIPLIRKALNDAGFGQVPVVSVSLGNQGVEETPGFKLTIPLAKRTALAFLYGDLFERVVYRTRPYEIQLGQVDKLHAAWLKRVRKNVINGSFREFKRNVQNIVRDFDNLPLRDIKKPRVGIVGEILVKYSPIANNNIVRLLEEEGAEVICPDIVGFMNYSLYNQIYRHDHLGFSGKSKLFAELALKVIKWCEKPMNVALKASNRFTGIEAIEQMADDASAILSLGNQTGEGWFLTGEMIECLKMGINNIVCMQPFGCLPNHIVGKGVVKELRSQYPGANITMIDYDPSVSFVNQLNRIRLMLATANKNLVR
ncbi:exopolyphosphatase [Liquorilactobacillus aquaticus DSM 21051]|uniref:Exopolyphosphatase n=1 Tax=Liquorilactobacillus aquaticus DSM 21051 TaxID=1423725 RepID=A0A0R2CT55_9LACO|nr:2-hydroxyacyl-CoA dehydratase [Liquorilactobacillus aquaticus]KRM94959.1 exopolyphosphatase [Liquorilactobacillus aquaticus DSM 21051]